MVYEKQFPECPYRGRGNNRCSHKGCKRCIYIHCPEKCDMYIEWEELKRFNTELPMAYDDTHSFGVDND